MPGQLEISRIIPATAERIYNAFLNPSEHSALTGEKAALEPDGSLSALGGFIKARTLQLATAKQIVQNWRTKNFPEGAPDTRVEIDLSEANNGTQVTLKQTGVPEGTEEELKNLWNTRYFDRMSDYFHTPASWVRGAGEAVVHAAEDAQEAIEEVAQKAQKQIKKATKQVKKVVKKAQTQIKKAQKPLQKAGKAALKKAKALAKKAKIQKPSKKGPAPKASAKKASTKKPIAQKAVSKKSVAKKATPAKKSASKKAVKAKK